MTGSVTMGGLLEGADMGDTFKRRTRLGGGHFRGERFPFFGEEVVEVVGGEFESDGFVEELGEGGIDAAEAFGLGEAEAWAARGDGESAAGEGFDEAIAGELVVGFGDGVGVDEELVGEGADGGEELAGLDGAGGDGGADLGDDLGVKGSGGAWGDADGEHGDTWERGGCRMCTTWNSTHGAREEAREIFWEFFAVMPEGIKEGCFN